MDFQGFPGIFCFGNHFALGIFLLLGYAGETRDICTANSILGRRFFEEHLSSETVGEGVTVRIVGFVAALLFLVPYGKQQHEKRTPGASRAGSSQQAASSKSSPPVPPPGPEM